jgi:hypothetical protein
MLARPALGGLEQPHARAETPLAFGDDEPIQFRARSGLNKVSDTDVRPADDSGAWRLRHKQRVRRRGFQLTQAFADLRRGYRISKLSAEFRKPWGVTGSRPADYDDAFL